MQEETTQPNAPTHAVVNAGRSASTVEAIKVAADKGYRVQSDGTVIGARGRPIKTMCKSGNQAFKVSVDGKLIWILVHQLVAFQQHGDSMFETEAVRHKNGNQLDNSVSNVKIGTQSECVMTRPPDVRRSAAISASDSILRLDWDAIDKDRSTGMSYKMLSARYGVALSTLSYRYGNGKRRRTTDR